MTTFPLHTHSGSPGAFRHKGLEGRALRFPISSAALNSGEQRVASNEESLFPAHSGSPSAYRHESLVPKTINPA